MSSTRIVRGQGMCATHGDYTYTAYRAGAAIVGATCPACREEAQMRASAFNAAAQVEEQEARRLKRLADAGIPLAFRDVSFENYRTSDERVLKEFRTVLAYADNFETVLATRGAPGMVFCGMQGTGKTHLGVAVISRLLSRGHSALYVSTPVLLARAREAGRPGSEYSVAQLIRHYSQPQLLVLDEYGAHAFAEFDYQMLFSVVDGRYQLNLPTVLITNVRYEVLRQELDERFLERVKGTGGPVLQFDWPSWRFRPAK